MLPSEPSPEEQTPPFGLNMGEFLDVQVSVLAVAVRAIIQNHPCPGKVRADFDMLIGQMQAHPAVLSESRSKSMAIRSVAEVLFSPPVSL